MFKTFIAGIILGVTAGAAALWFLPPVDQEREHSIISVMPNGGNSEAFHANIPTDRIMIGAPDQENPLPAGMQWPDDALLADVRTELFKIRNSRDAVVGVASRIAASNENGDLVEWVLHLPARGSAYVAMNPGLTEQGNRVGVLRSGTREFADRAGRLSERWVADTTGNDDAPAGRIELQAMFVSTAVAEEIL